MEDDLAAALLANAALTTLVGRRIQWLERPQGANLPAVVLQVVGNPLESTFRHRVGLIDYRVQVSCFASAYRDAGAVRAAVGAATDGLTEPFRGVFPVYRAPDTLDQAGGAAAANGGKVYGQHLVLLVKHFSAA